jgi:hypothetical protein
VKITADFSELERLADDLATNAPRQALDAARKATIAEGALVQSRARDAAPRDRPWLATSGIRRRSGSVADAVWSYIFTVPDPEGRPVGFFVEYGTSVMPPQAFMEPAAAPAEQTFPVAVLAAIDPFRSSSGSGPTDSGDG